MNQARLNITETVTSLWGYVSLTAMTCHDYSWGPATI